MIIFVAGLTLPVPSGLCIPIEMMLINRLTQPRKERWKYANFKIVVNLQMDRCQKEDSRRGEESIAVIQ